MDCDTRLKAHTNALTTAVLYYQLHEELREGAPTSGASSSIRYLMITYVMQVD